MNPQQKRHVKYPFIWIVILMLSGVCFAPCCPKNDPVPQYLAFGDSATEGAETPTYPQILADLLDVPKEVVANLGESGETIAQGETRWLELLACDPYPHASTLLFWEGGNDIVDFVEANDPYLHYSPDDPRYPYAQEFETLLNEIAGHLRTIITSAQDAGFSVYVGNYYEVLANFSPCPTSPFDQYTRGEALKVNQYVAHLNETIGLVTKEMDVPLADMASTGALYDDPENYHDCHHASAKGNAIIAEIWYQVLRV